MNIRYAPSFYYFKKCTYLPLGVLITLISNFNYEFYLELPKEEGEFGAGIASLINRYLKMLGRGAENINTTDYYKILTEVPDDLWNILFSKYETSYFSKVNEYIDYDDFKNKVNNHDFEGVVADVYGRVADLLLHKIIPVYLSTKDRYNTLLDLYQSNKNNLLNQLKRINDYTNIQNDTPVIDVDDNDLSSNKYASNILKHHNESQYDVDTIMGRLDEVSNKYRNLLEEWSDEFKGIFWGLYYDK